jgi:2-hydroxy-6-oxonona-2,4-dienedioate hydrolase
VIDMSNASQEFRSVWTGLKLVPFQQDFIDVAGIRTRYAHAGRKGAPAILMLHGTAGHWEAYSANLASHAEHFDCYAIDSVGCGFSDKPDHPYEISTYVEHLRGFMTAIGLKRASVIGMSMGSWVAARFAIKYPELTDKLVLLSAAGYFATPSNMARIRGVRSASVNDPSWENIKAIFNHLLAKEDSRIPDLISLRQEIYRQPGMQKAMQHILALQDPEIRQRNLIKEDEWRSIKAPTLVIGSLADKDEYLETARIVSKLIPNATYVDMHGVGHWPQWEDPETFNRLNIEFMLNGKIQSQAAE